VTDIVEKLRAYAVEWRDEMQPAIGEPLDEAADEIERLREALSDLLRCTERHVFGDECKSQRDIARAALKESDA
jgi:hypothetical protein